jgi:hypothetical protein
LRARARLCFQSPDRLRPCLFSSSRARFQRVDSGQAAESGVKVGGLISLLGAAWCNKSRSQKNYVRFGRSRFRPWSESGRRSHRDFYSRRCCLSSARRGLAVIGQISARKGGLGAQARGKAILIDEIQKVEIVKSLGARLSVGPASGQSTALDASSMAYPTDSLAAVH